ncbi:MAG: hypothetical protein A4E28_02848 [Methanocella sp. PtaU1.Bin125]|nr:MAG: hypothetical protein A4E28_02848 [Methanocella sp. PtaU1.Bin125]
MSDGREIVRTAATIALFALMLYYAYFFTLDVSLENVRDLMPEPIRGEIDRATAGIPEDQRQSLNLPLPEVKRYGDIYLGTAGVIPGEMDAMPWILEHTDRSDRFVADIFGAELIMGMTTRISTVGGDWANAPDPVRMMTDTTGIYKTTDPAEASRLAKALNATLVYLPRRQLNTGWWVPQEEVKTDKFLDTGYFKEVYGTDSVTIYRIL